MNILSSAIQHIRLVIPEEILTEAFLGKKYKQRNLTYSLDAMIRSEVIGKKAAIDMNMVGGTVMFIPLRGIPIHVVDNVNVVLTIPRTHTQGRNITTALSISLADNYAPAISIGYGQSIPSSAYLQAVGQVVNSVLLVPMVGSAHVRLVDENTIMINEAPNSIEMCYLKCIIEHDAEFTSIQPASYPVFRDLITLAAKSIIYNEMIIKMGKGYLTGGMELGVFKDIIDGYADAEVLYQELLINKWIKVSFFNDSESKRAHLVNVAGLI